MPSADFSAARERLAARARSRASAVNSSTGARRNTRSTSLTRLPLPLRSLGAFGLAIWDNVNGREGTRPAFRVGQVDAELLDEELLELLKGQVGEGLKFLGSHLRDDHSAEILLALRAILFKLTIWDHNASYGAALQGLRYSDARDSANGRSPPKSWQKFLYGIVTVFGRYGWTKWEEWLIDQEGGYEEPSPSIRRLSQFTSSLSTFHSIAALASFLTFLLNGRFRTLLDRVLRLRLTPTSSSISREVSFEYLNRQLVWHAFTEFLLFLLPLVGIARWRRILSRVYKRIWNFFTSTFRRGVPGEDDAEGATKSGELGFLPERTCAICYKDQTPGGGSEAELLSGSGGGVVGSASTDITNPYSAIPCGCLYCYVCLAQRLEAEEGEGWTCLRCGELVKECRPWDGDVLEEKVPRPVSTGSVKVVSFEDDADRTTTATDAEDEDAELQNVDPMPLQDDSTDHQPVPDPASLSASTSWIQAGPSETETSDYDEDDDGEF